MAYDSIITRSDAAALMPEDVSSGIIQALPTQSVALSAFRRVPMSRNQQRMPVIAALPTAYWVNGETGLKQTSKVDWTNKYLDAEELAVIVPIPEAVLDDTAFDVWGEIKPLIQEAIGAALDAAVFFGTNKPVGWTADDIVAGAVAASSVYNSGSNASIDLAEEINQVWAFPEGDGFAVNFQVGAPILKSALRGLRATTTGALLFQPSMQAGTPGTLYGEPIRYMDNGAFDTAKARLIVGDSRAVIIGVRQDITYKVLDQAVIQDGTGAIVYNLAQQDMVALRVVARFAYALPNPPTRLVGSSGFPFGVLQP